MIVKVIIVLLVLEFLTLIHSGYNLNKEIKYSSVSNETTIVTDRYLDVFGWVQVLAFQENGINGQNIIKFSNKQGASRCLQILKNNKFLCEKYFQYF